MRDIVRAGIAALATMAPIIAAQAADRALPTPQAAPYNWTGCYIGVQGGLMVLYDHWAYAHEAGGLAGGQIGCNHQKGSLVFGIEAEGWWSDIKTRFNQTVPAFTFTIDARSRWDAAVSARAGVALDRALIFGKVGIAWGRFSGFTQLDNFGLDLRGGPVTLTGLLLGVGIEYAVAPNWTAKVEYGYIGYLDRNVHMVDAVNQFEADQIFTATKYFAKVGINYRFGEQRFSDPSAERASSMPVKAPVTTNPPPAPHDWSGCYIGVHGGGGIQYPSYTFLNAGSAIVGGQAGCNRQFGTLVVGIEAEGWWADYRSRGAFSQPGFSNQNTVRSHGGYDVALRGGVAFDRSLFFGKLGVAWSRFDLSRVRQTQRLGTEDEDISTNGLLSGVGLEYALSESLSAKFEYNYVSYFGRRLQIDGIGSLPDRSVTFSAVEHVVKVGVNYRIGGAPSLPMGVPLVLTTAAPAYDWTGCYVGAQLGGGGLWYDFGVHAHGGLLAGGQVGCNRQLDRVVIGVEGGGWWSNLQTRNQSATTTTTTTGKGKAEWGAELALRAGIAQHRTLYYGKVGAAWSEFDLDQRSSNGNFVRGNPTHFGPLLGAGVEHAVTEKWTAKVEYNYIAYLAKDVRLETRNGTELRTLSGNAHLIKGAVNYQLGRNN